MQPPIQNPATEHLLMKERITGRVRSSPAPTLRCSSILFMGVRYSGGNTLINVLWAFGANSVCVTRCVAHYTPSCGPPFIRDRVVNEEIGERANENHLWGLPTVRLREVLIHRHLPRLQPVPPRNNTEQRIAVSAARRTGRTAFPRAPRLTHLGRNFDALSQLLQPHITSSST